MNMQKDKAFRKHSFTHEVMDIFAFAGILARKQREKKILCVHVFVACAYLQQDVMHKLFGREITLLPKKFKTGNDLFTQAFFYPARSSDNGGKSSLTAMNDSMDFADELAAIFLDDSPDSTLRKLQSYYTTPRIGVPEIIISIASEPTEEIGSILLANNFPNDARHLEDLLRDNYLGHCSDFMTDFPRERLKNAIATTRKFKEKMNKLLFGQREAVSDVTSFLTDFWFRGNNGRPLSILLLSKSGGGRSFFADAMQRAFVEIGLQNKVESPLDMSGFVNDNVSDSILLGDAKSYKCAHSGILYELANSNHRGVMVFEDVLEGTRSAKTALRAFATNLAFDKFNEECIRIPFNVLVFTMKVTDDQYRFLKEKSVKKIDAKLLNRLFVKSKDDEKKNARMENAAMDSAELWRCIDRIIMLDQLSPAEMEALAENHMKEIEKRLKKDYDIEFRCSNLKDFITVFLQSTPDEMGPGELIDGIDDAFGELWRILNDAPDVNSFELLCDAIPEYRHDPERRLIRGDFLAFTKKMQIKGKTVQLAIQNIHYVQQDRIDCGDYRIEHPKGITFDDIIGLDEVRDELLDALRFITNRDQYPCKIPEPCLNYILYGLPGTGKTSLAVALANYADIPAFFVPSSVFTDAQKVGDMFRKARSMAPAIVVLDEFNSIGDSSYVWKRDAINEMLAILDGPRMHSKLLIIASTNHINQIEKALLRPGRFGRQIEIKLPNEDARKSFILKFEKEYDIALPDEARNALVTETGGTSLADLKGILGYAMRSSFRNNQPLDVKTLTRAVHQFKKPMGRPQIGFNRGDER